MESDIFMTDKSEAEINAIEKVFKGKEYFSTIVKKENFTIDPRLFSRLQSVTVRLPPKTIVEKMDKKNRQQRRRR